MPIPVFVSVTVVGAIGFLMLLGVAVVGILHVIDYLEEEV